MLAGSVPRDVVDAAVAVYGRESKRSDGKLPAHVMVYFAMALALFAEDDYEGVLARLAEPLMAWGCWDASWSMPGSAGITQARQRLGAEPVREVFERVARPVCGVLTRGAWLAGRRLVSVDGSELDVPDSPANAEFFGYAGGATRRSAFPKARLVTLVETGSRAPIGAVIGPVVGKGQGSRAWPVGCIRCWSRACCCWPIVTSTAGATGVRLPIPARTCCGGPVALAGACQDFCVC
ncbi:transposase domain-containing protein [Phytohabitans flavus]|uniref:transposase domain-containing protein n=1 Tax=Phytohabitans flavus TaxID=1076124 RepID=UPI0036342B9C